MEYLFYLLFVFNFSFYFLHNLHMYQLNYYKPEVQKKWLNNNPNSYIVNSALTIIQIIFINYDLFLLAILIGILLFLYNFPKKAKKKLVFTPRVWRIIIELIIIIMLKILVIYLINSYFIKHILLAVYIFIPLLILVIDYTQQPLNKIINQKFIDDAKRILKLNPNLLVIGITGSYGKTSMKYFLTEFLSTKYDVLMTPGNLNTTLGVVRTIRENLKPTHEIFVCEMGATKPNDIKEICDIVKPKHGIITSIGPQHLESFKTIENVITTKFELANSLPEEGLLFLNYDNEYIQKNKDKHEIISYGIENKKVLFKATNIKGNNEGLSFKVNNIKFTTKLIGKHNILNILGALAVSNEMGIKLTDLVEKVRRLEPVSHRLELKEVKNRIIIDDAYNSNPVGSKYALEAMNDFKGIKILITPGMVELGEQENEFNYQFGKQAAEICDYVLLVNENQSKFIYQGLVDNKFNKKKIFVFKTFNEAYNKLNELDKEGKLIVLIENDLPDQY